MKEFKRNFLAGLAGALIILLWSWVFGITLIFGLIGLTIASLGGAVTGAYLKSKDEPKLLGY